MIVDACTRFAPSRACAGRDRARVVVIVVVGVVPQIHETQRVTKYRLLGQSYDALHRLDELTRTDGDGAVVYSGSSDRADATGSTRTRTARSRSRCSSRSTARCSASRPRRSARTTCTRPTTARAVLQAQRARRRATSCSSGCAARTQPPRRRAHEVARERRLRVPVLGQTHARARRAVDVRAPALRRVRARRLSIRRPS